MDGVFQIEVPRRVATGFKRISAGWNALAVGRRERRLRSMVQRSLLLGGVLLVCDGRFPSKSWRCLCYVRSIEDLVSNSSTMFVVNALTAQTRPRRSMTCSLWSANR